MDFGGCWLLRRGLAFVHVPSQMFGRLHRLDLDSWLYPLVRRIGSHFPLQCGSGSFQRKSGIFGNANFIRIRILPSLWVHLLRYFWIPSFDAHLLLQQNQTRSRSMQCCWPVHHQSLPNHVTAYFLGYHPFGNVGCMSRVHDLLTFCHWIHRLRRRCLHFSQKLQLVEFVETLLFHFWYSLVERFDSSYRHFHSCFSLLYVVLQPWSQQRTRLASYSQSEDGIPLPFRKLGIRLIHFGSGSVPANDRLVGQEASRKHRCQPNEMLLIRHKLPEMLPRLRGAYCAVHQRNSIHSNRTARKELLHGRQGRIRDCAEQRNQVLGGGGCGETHDVYWTYPYCSRNHPGLLLPHHFRSLNQVWHHRTTLFACGTFVLIRRLSSSSPSQWEPSSWPSTVSPSTPSWLASSSTKWTRKPREARLLSTGPASSTPFSPTTTDILQRRLFLNDY